MGPYDPVYILITICKVGHVMSVLLSEKHQVPYSTPLSSAQYLILPIDKEYSRVRPNATTNSIQYG